MAPIVIDNCTLVNFAAVGRLDFLYETLRGRGCWTQAIEYECRKSAAFYPSLTKVLDGGWLGDAVEFDNAKDVREITNIRNALSTPLSKPTDNLGEAEAIHAILSRPVLKGAIFLTDDTFAADFAKFKHITVWHSMHFMSDAYSSGDIGCPAAYEVLEDMARRDRGVFVPTSHREVCP